MRLKHEVMLFAVGGAIGFIVDAGIVQLLVTFAHVNPYAGRVVSFLIAATVTWWWNRSHTFATRQSGRSLGAEWLHWMALMGGGAAVNYGAYAACLFEFPAWHKWPVLAVAVGSFFAAFVNFVSARTLLFRRAKTHS
ncbi:GtrA family protein [Dyella acidiphila]|uniref:GtrA family protein n=1 Tax=Dyella acidiphila TaxID=2775866 RepID=A0ABR9GB29_9GAMM|nr:GtrA family protein [Dyella acidiphila]MBE1161226.1 GtrA family protein [Dyella acidiphila]